MIDTKNLISVQNYAHAEKVSTSAVYKWINKNLVKCVEIDGIKFIIKKAPSK